jgi:predicted secreted protein
MSPLYAFFIYLLIWWVVIFTVLPIGVTRNDDDGRGFDSGAPRVPHLKKKLVLTTVISAVILAVVYVLVEMDIIRWTEWFAPPQGEE